MDKQEVFNKVYTHLLTQNKQARQRGNRLNRFNEPECRYRTDDGLKCAVGCLIKDEFYAPYIEGVDGRAAIVLEIVAKSLGCGVFEIDLDFLFILQRIHDTQEPEDWPEHLAELASNFSLTIPSL